MFSWFSRSWGCVMVKKIRNLASGSQLFKSLCKNIEGVTAIEFAMVAPIFFGLLLMIIETGIVFAAQQVLDSSVNTASRTVLTGAAQQQAATDSNNGGASFRNRVCAGMSGLIGMSECQSGIMIDMKAFGATPSSATLSASLATPATAGIPDKTLMNCASLGGGNDYMLIRAYYQYPVYVSYLSAISGSTSGHSLIVGSAAMKLEPFTGSAIPPSNACP